MRLDDELAERATSLESAAGVDAAFVQQARAGAARLAPVELATGDVRGALALLTEHAEIDAVVPVAASRREVVLAKQVLRRALAWYGRWLAHQMTLLGGAIVRFGTATAERIEAVEGDVDALAARVAALEARAARGGDRDAGRA